MDFGLVTTITLLGSSVVLLFIATLFSKPEHEMIRFLLIASSIAMLTMDVSALGTLSGYEILTNTNSVSNITANTTITNTTTSYLIPANTTNVINTALLVMITIIITVIGYIMLRFLFWVLDKLKNMGRSTN